MSDYRLTPKDHVAALLSLIIQRAPEKARHSIARGVIDMKATDEPDEIILLYLAEILIDGLRWENWPTPPLPN